MSQKLLKPALITGAMTLLSRVSGMVRDTVFARMIGAGIAADAFYVAFRIPNFLRRIFGDGAFAQAFVPVFAEYKTQGEHERMRAFVASVTGVLGLILFIVTLVGTLIAPFLVMALAPGFSDEPGKHALTVEMLRIMFPYLLFISLVALSGGVLNTFGNFAVPAFTPVLLNLAMIASALWAAPHMAQPVIALAWGVFVAGVLQLAFQFPALKRLHLLTWPRVHFADLGVKRVFRLMLPAVFSGSVAQVNLLVNTVLASYLVSGSVAWLYYADRLMEFPLGIFGVALATVILPSLSQKHASASHGEFSHTLDWALRVACLITVPATVALIVLSEVLVVTLFQYGKFTAFDVHMTSLSLIAFSLGLPAFVLIKILAPGFYARFDMKTPVRIGVISVGVNIGLSVVFVFGLKHVGLALATSLAAFVNAALLFRGLYRSGVYRPDPGWRIFLTKIALASAMMGGVLWWDGRATAAWLNANAWHRVGRLGFWVAVGILIYSVAVWLLRVEWRSLLLRPTVKVGVAPEPPTE